MRKGRNEKTSCICGSEIQSNVYVSLLATLCFEIRCALLQKRHTRILRVKTEYLMRSSSLTSHSAFELLPSTRLPVFKCLTVRIPPAPQVTKHITKDVIRAQRAVPAHGTTPSMAAQFDTVLARESDEDEEVEHPLDGRLINISMSFCTI
jgi:hypothetical protein